MQAFYKRIFNGVIAWFILVVIFYNNHPNKPQCCYIYIYIYYKAILRFI